MFGLGAPRYDNSGAAFVYRNDPVRGWRQVQQLRPQELGIFDGFGTSVAISGGNILVGSPGHGAGAAYLFHSVADSWKLSSTFAPSETNVSQFGVDVAIDGDVIVVGTRENTAFVYSLESDRNWAEVARLSEFVGTAEADEIVLEAGTLTINGKAFEILTDQSVLTLGTLAGNDTVTILGVPAQLDRIEFFGGAGIDSLYGPSQDAQWKITGPNQGLISFAGNSVAFFGFERLRGGDAKDSFEFTTDSATVAHLDGGAGEEDSIELLGTEVEFVPISAGDQSAGTLLLNNTSTEFQNVEVVRTVPTRLHDVRMLTSVVDENDQVTFWLT